MTKMFHSQELSDLPQGKRLFVLSRAYIEGSEHLCRALLAEDYAAEFASSRVVLHLCCHGVELFFKGAIHCASRRTPRRTHELHKLGEEYSRLFPSPDFQFAIPFWFETLDSEELFEELNNQFHKTLDQRYRYPVDKQFAPFDGPEGFQPDVFLSEIEALRVELVKLEIRILSSLNLPTMG
ncbi:hypothetical protein [Paraburkholderia nemoris]|uniref:HEPN domain-containing protein n=1 Tax=Paraburkholderia nemoris TaxID=2793076 RepID=A0ABN7M5D8_9BURK|nr:MULTISPECIES: hypothetical protein [Paraburkholderia]KPD19649.1 hypothetical protein ADM96_04145 [Burkholderia sp. ST111]MBK3812620.1 hypothetical protein [Paraburkholderia aspalathi]CAE6706842.1 hypothetical protein R75777_00947 [Paraburkholderia nemoris]CAE6786488.1 hypothetical protein R69776_04566 [Paraburkholderia nemoris]